MTSASSLLRSLLIYSICLPLAIFLGYLIAQEGNPIFNLTTYIGILPILFILALPLLLRWHHGLLIVIWNFGAVLYFVPGRPDLWTAVAGLSLSLSIVQRILNPGLRFLSAPSVSRPLLLLAAVILVTAECRGGIGIRSFGSELYGGKRYVMVLAGIIGYFALTCRPIPPKYAVRYVVLFILGSGVAFVGDLGSILPESLYFIYLMFPISQHGFSTIFYDPASSVLGIDRLGGVALAGCAGFNAMLARYGIQELFGLRRFVPLLVFLLLVGLSTLGGFRGNVVNFILLFSILFYFEGLMRSRLLPAFALIVLLVGPLLIGFARHLPLNIQRTLTVLHVPVDPVAQADAAASSEWRVEMWKQVIPQIPQYLLLGKGFGFSAKDLQSLETKGTGQSGQDAAELVSNFHNGPLSIIIPFGIWGAIGFLWFIASSIRALYRNYRHGHPAYSTLNRFLLAYFISKAIFFFFVFGDIYPDLAMFTGLIGLSISLNGGIARRRIFLPPPPNFQRRMIRLPQGMRKPISAYAGVGHPA